VEIAGDRQTLRDPPVPVNPFLELDYFDRFARTVCDAEVSDLCWTASTGRPLPHPITTDLRRQRQMQQWHELESAALRCAKGVEIPLPELDGCLRAYGEALLDVMTKRDTPPSTEQFTRFSSPWYGCEQGGSWEPAIAACRELDRRMRVLYEATQTLGRLAEYHAQGALPRSTGVGRMPLAWPDLFERVANHFKQLSTTTSPPAESADAGRDQGEANSPEGAAAKLAPSRQKALSQYIDAKEKCPHLSTDREVYDWLKEHSDGDPLPSFASWSRYLRHAFDATDGSRNTRRSGRTARSVVRQDEI
jgi:hypothetical protein